MEAEDKAMIKNLVPFNRMNDGDLSTVLEKTRVEVMPGSKMIFKRSQQDDKVYWLLAGAVDLLDENFEVKNSRAGDSIARNPIDNNSPHRVTAVTTEDARVLICDRRTIPIMEEPARPVQDTGETIDWMTNLLDSPLFEFIPPANIQALFNRFSEVRYKSGSVVIAEGEKGDCFYVIRTGEVKVERSAAGGNTLLAMLTVGDCFGQDAMVSDAPRNATVTMTSDGTLMKLSAPDFQELLATPVIEMVTTAEASAMIEKADPETCIIDVRSQQEAGADMIPGSRNLPLPLLRKNLCKLKKNAVYITACDGGKRSQLGAYQLNEEGFTAYVLKR